MFYFVLIFTFFIETEESLSWQLLLIAVYENKSYVDNLIFLMISFISRLLYLDAKNYSF